MHFIIINRYRFNLLNMHKIISVVTLFVLSMVCHVDPASAQPLRSASTKAVNPGFTVEPAPGWVLPVPADAGGKVTPAAMHSELIDEQAQVDARGQTNYNHLIRVVDGIDGLAAASEIRIEFNPSYETLVFHKVEILRKGARINKLERSKLRMLQRESNLEQQVYDGSTTASLVLEDVRVGDRVDFSYSIKGENPVFDGKYVHTAWMAGSKGPARVARFRLLIPQNRTVLHRAGPDVKVTETLHDGLRDMQFLRISVAQLHGDQFTPASAFLGDQINLSEFTSWNGVAMWGTGLYAPFLNASSELVRKTAQNIAAKAEAAPLEKLRLALDFVQNEVRYFGTEIGENTHRPTAPDVVIKQRFGDCKDKALLLMALLKELGMSAEPVLVSTQLRNDLPVQFATPLVFNHVITRVELDGKVYWLDGTRAGQTGSVAQRQSVGLGKGLLLRAGTAELVDLPGTDTEERISVEENYRINAFSEPPLLDLRTTYFGELAEMLRNAVASQPLETLEAKLNEDFARFHPNVQKIAALRVEDVADQNAVRVVQTFAVPKFWRLSDDNTLVADYALWNLVSPLKHTESTFREQSFQLYYPGIYRHTVTLDFAEEVIKGPASTQARHEDQHLYMHVESNVEPRKFQAKGELQLLKDVVFPSEWSDYTNLLRKAEKNFGGAFTVAPINVTQAEKLKKDVTELVESWQGLFAKNRPVTSVQSKAMVRRLLLTAELEGGRLNPELRAQVLNMRGIQFDNLGLYDLARADFDAALKLVPNDGSIRAAAAANHLLSGRDALALEYAKKALESNPSSNAPHKTLAHALYFGKDYAEAKRHLLTLLKDRSEVDDGYATIWLYLAAKRGNEDAPAVVKPYMTRDKSVWPHPLLQYLIGEGTLEQSMEAARAGQKDEGRLCELYFYVGEKYFIDGKASLAREYFKKSLDTGVVEFYEYGMSKRSLKMLDGL